MAESQKGKIYEEKELEKLYKNLEFLGGYQPMDSYDEIL